MKWCPNCKTFQPNEYRFCPECCNELERNEASSEDGDDGKFLPSPGTKEWAVYQIQRGEKVFHYKAKTLIYDKPSHYVRRFRLDKHLDDMSLEIWLNGADPTGWEIYQPKPCHVCNGTGFVSYDDMDGITTQSCLCGTGVVSQETAKDESQKPKPVFCETQKPLLADANDGDNVRLRKELKRFKGLAAKRNK